MRPVITIDGPAGVGKSTAARAVAARLGFVYLDSGALYRALALAALRAEIRDVRDRRLGALVERLVLRAAPHGKAFRVWLAEEEVTTQLRAPEISQHASRLATLPMVRARVGELLRELAGRYPCVAEGRDMGSVVFPDAALKIFLRAPLEVRAQRRAQQLAEAGALAAPAGLAGEIAERDTRDQERAHSPLRAAPDALQIDNEALGPGAQANLIAELYRGGGRLPGSRFYRVVRTAARLLLRLLGGLRVRGAERVPRGACLLAANHRSYLDPPLLAASAPGAIAFLAKEELFRLPVLGAAIRSLGGLPIRRGRFDRQGLGLARRALGQAQPLVIFPEGTRQHGSGGYGRARRGVSFLAHREQVPVVPVWIGGQQDLWRALLRRPALEVRFGEPIRPPGGMEEEEGGAFEARVMEAIARLGKPARQEGA